MSDSEEVLSVDDSTYCNDYIALSDEDNADSEEVLSDVDSTSSNDYIPLADEENTCIMETTGGNLHK